MIKQCLALVVTLLLSAGALAETLAYEIYALRTDGSSKLLVSDTRTYSVPTDIRVVDIVGNDGSHLWSKELQLAKDFHIDVAVTRESAIGGFGITIGNDHWPMAFSWNWFNAADSGEGLFEQLKGNGLVRVTTRKVQGEELEEIAAVEFLTDVRLTGLDNLLATDPGKPRDTHAIVVKKGSILRVAN